MWKGLVPCANFWPKLSDSLQVTPQTLPLLLGRIHPSTAAICCEDTYKSFSGCLLRGEYEESFLFKLANVLQVLPWGSVIVGHLRHCWREGNYWGALPKQRGQCTGNAEYTRVYAKINTRTQKDCFSDPQHSHSLSHAPAYKAHAQTHTHTLEQKENYTCMRIKTAHTSMALVCPALFTLSYSDSSYFWSVTNGIYLLYVSWERLSLILEETQCVSLDRR